MVGTLLKDDLQSSIEDQLQQYARGLTVVGDTAADLQRAGRQSLDQVTSQLQDYANQVSQATQQSGVYQAGQQAVAGAQAAVQQAPHPLQVLSDYANQVVNQPPPQPVQQPDVYAIAGGPAAGAPTALPHTEEPATASDQVAGGPQLGGNWKTQFDFGSTYTGDYRTGTPHRGVDLVPSNGKGIGTEVDAFAPGTVTNIFRDPGGAGGLIVYVQDADGLTHAYMHLAGTVAGLQVGQHVDRGTPIAMMGESGTEGSPHLHYEVRKNASTGDPTNELIDPRPYMSGAKQPTGGVGGAVATGATSLGTNVNRVVQQATGQALPESSFEWKVNAGQSLSRDQVIQAGQQVGLSAEDAAYLYDAGVRNNIDAGSALAIIKLEGNARNPNNNIFDISNAMYGGHPVPGSRWGQYDSKQQGIDAYYTLLNKEYIPNGQDTIGTIMHGPGSGPNTSTSHAYAPISENRASYPQEVLDQVKAWGGQAQQAVSGAVAGTRRTTGDVIEAGQQVAARAPIVYNTAQDAIAGAHQQLQVIQDQVDALRSQLAGAPEAARQAAEPLIAGARESVGGAFDTFTRAAQAQPLPSETLTTPLGPRYMGAMVPGSSDTSASSPGAISGQPSTPLDQAKQKFNDALDSLGQIIQPAQQTAEYLTTPQSVTDLTQGGPMGAFRQELSTLGPALTGGRTLDIQQDPTRQLTAARQSLGQAIASTSTGDVPVLSGAAGLGAQLVGGFLQAPSAVDAAQTVVELEQKYGTRDTSQWSAEDRQAYTQALMAVGGITVPPERGGEPARPGRPTPDQPQPTQILGPRGEVLSTVTPEVPTQTGFRAPVTGRVTDVGTRQRVSPSGEILSATTGEPIVAAGKELAGNIRLPKFVQQPVRDIIEQVYAADPQRFDAARRGVVTNEMLQDLADQAGTEVNRVAARWKPGRAENAETVLALRQALADRALRVRAAQKLLRDNPGSIDARNTMLEAMNQHAALQEVVHGVTSEAGRTVAQFRQPVTGEEAALSALQRIAKNTKMTPAELTEHLANVDLSDPTSVAKLARTLTGYTFKDKAQALWYFMLLSNPLTQVRNILGNATVLATRPLESLAAAGIDAVRADLTGTARQRFFSEAPAELAGGINALGPALKAGFRTLRTGLTPQDLANPENIRAEPFQGRLADLTVNAPGRMLAATDALFRTLNQGASLHKEAARQAAREGTALKDLPGRIAEIVRNPDQALLDRSAADAAYRVFQNKNELATAVGKVREAMPLGTGRFVLPFVNTPVNVGAYALERSPLGVAKLLRGEAERSGGQLSDNLARATLGTALAGYIATQAAQGNITGAAPTDPTERDAWQREGKQPYSIKVGDTWYSYAPLQPFSSIIAAGAAAGEAWRKGQDDPTSGLNPASLIALTGVAAARAMLDQPWLQGMSGLVDALTSSNDVQGQGDPLKSISLNAQRALASAVVPAGVRQLARMFDPTVRTSDPGWEGFGQQIAASIPGLSQNAPPRLNAFGQPTQRPQSGLGALNPFNPSQQTDDPVEKELRRLQDGGYDVEPNLVSNRVTLISEAIKLTPEQQRQYQAMAGTMTHDLLESLMQTDAYRNLRSDQQALVINRLSDRVADAARKTLYPSLLDQAVEQKIAETARRQQTKPPDWLIRQATGSAEAPSAEAPSGSANRTVSVP